MSEQYRLFSPEGKEWLHFHVDLFSLSSNMAVVTWLYKASRINKDEYIVIIASVLPFPRYASTARFPFTVSEPMLCTAIKGLACFHPSLTRTADRHCSDALTSRPRLTNFSPSIIQEGKKIFGKCGGYCGSCGPDRDLQLVLSRGM